jgi:hypothetical protein
MPVAIKIPPVRRQIFNTDEKEAAFIDVLNQIDAAQRNGYERSLEVHLKAFREWIDRRFEVADEKQRLTLQGTNQRLEQATHELKLYVNQLVAESDTKNEKRFTELKADLKIEFEKRFAEMEVKSAERHASQLKWMVTFFSGLLFILVGLMFTYLQLMGKP